MGKFVLTSKQIAEILNILARETGESATLKETASALSRDPKKEKIVLFTDNFGHMDVKQA